MAQQIKKKFIKNDAVDGSKIKLLSGQSLRIEGPAGEIELLKLGSEGEVLSKGQEVAFKSQVTQLRSDLESAIESEESRAMGVEGSLQSALSSEESARIAGDASLQSQIDNILSNVDPAALDSLTEVVNAFQEADSDLQAAISALGTGSTSALTEEISRAQAAELSLQSNIDAEQSARIAADLVLEESIDSEMSRAMSIEGSLQSQITAESSRAQSAEQGLQDDINAEELRAMGVEGSLQSQITQEVSDRIAAVSAEESRAMSIESSLQTQINDVVSDLSSEVSRAMDIEDSLQSQITQEISDRIAAVSSEMSRAVGVEGSIQAALDQEISNRISAVSGEESRAMAAEESLQQQINELTTDDVAEGSNLYYTDERVQTKLGNVTGHIVPETDETYDLGSSTKKFRDLFLSGNTIQLGDVSLSSDPTEGLSVTFDNGDFAINTDNVQEGMVNKFFTEERVQQSELSLLDVTKSGEVVSSDSVVDGISKLQNQVTQEISDREEAVSSEMSRAMSAEGSLSSAISSEMSRAMGVEGSLSSAISSEESARISADQSLQTQINNILSNVDPAALDSLTEVVAAFQEADQDLLDAISALGTGSNSALGEEISRAQAAEASLQSQIDSEITRAQGVESSLQSQIDSEITRAQSVESSLQSQIDAEESRAMGVESSLQSQIDSEVSRAMGVESSLQSQITAEVSARTAADLTKADVTLNNLGTTAINASLIPGANNSINLGKQSNADKPNNKIYANAYVSNYRVIDGGGTDTGSLSGSKFTPSGVGGAGFSGNAHVMVYSDNANNSSSTWSARLETGNNAGTGASGDVVIRTGTVTSGTRGEVSLTGRQINVNSVKVVNLANGTTSTDAVNKGQLDSSVSAEMSRAMAAEGSLQSAIDSEESRAMLAESGLDSRLTTAEGDIVSLEGRMDTAESDIVSLEGRMDTAEGDIVSLEGRMDEVESDVSTLQSQMLNAESDINSLEGRMDVAEGDISAIEGSISSEVSRAMAAEEALDLRLDVIEAKTFGKQKIVIGSELSYIELEREVVANSLVVFVNRLGAHKDEDYTVSVVGGKTRLTWINSFASMGSEAIESGDEIFVTFYY